MERPRQILRTSALLISLCLGDGFARAGGRIGPERVSGGSVHDDELARGARWHAPRAFFPAILENQRDGLREALSGLVPLRPWPLARSTSGVYIYMNLVRWSASTARSGLVTLTRRWMRATVRHINPRAVWCSVSPFGSNSAWCASRAGQSKSSRQRYFASKSTRRHGVRCSSDARHCLCRLDTGQAAGDPGSRRLRLTVRRISPR